MGKSVLYTKLSTLSTENRVYFVEEQIEKCEQLFCKIIIKM